MNKKIDTRIAISLLVIVTALALLLILTCRLVTFPAVEIILRPLVSHPASELEVEKFSSEDDFKAYLLEAELGYSAALSLGGARATAMAEAPGTIELSSPLAADGKGGGEPERVSETNVQVAGIDEPDIVKTDGKEIYFSPQRGYYWTGPWLEEIAVPRITGQTKIIRAFPPTDLALENKIEKSGDLLLSKNILVVFSGDSIFGYDVSNPKSPQEKWKVDFEEKSYLAGARLYQDKVYLITKTSINQYNPCPIRPLSIGGVTLEIKCTDVYHPRVKIPVDITYSAMILDPSSGEIENTVSFVGASGSSIVYMSEDFLYLAYYYHEGLFKFISDFLQEKCQDLFPAWLIEEIKKLEDYDISDIAKMTEFEVIFEQYKNSLSRDDELKLENELENRIEDYYQSHKRELEKTGIVKIELEKFEVEATGNVPGQPLNQFSLDEYNGYLRIATTIGQMTGESANDVYVLDKNLMTTGQVLDLGLTESIYSVRFIQDKGYIVTFRQIDPFYVLDLSDPENPALKGELKIPGYSSYLHPVTKDKILGIGREESKVKVSLFDVVDPEEPSEVAKYTLQEYWSDILNTHHAFLLDSEHQIFFLPGSRGGYVFSYKDDKLEMVKAVSDISAKRAIYINDYLYIIGDNKISVLNEINWEKVKELDLEFQLM